MATVLVRKAGAKGWEQSRIPHSSLVSHLMQGYHLIPYSLIITIA